MSRASVMMNLLLPPFSHNRRKSWQAAWSLAGLTLLIGTGGCASHHSASLLVEHQVRPALTNTSSEKGLNLKVVTYNIWGLPSWMTGARPGRYPQIARELERLDADIVLLQEVWIPEARKSVPSSGRWVTARPAGQNTLAKQCGLVTLSKWSVIGGEFYPFSRAAFPDRLVTKGMLKVTVQLPGGQVLNVWNVHLQEGGSPKIRLSQIRELGSHVLSAEDGQIADLVGGDFNCTPGSPEFEKLVSLFGPSVQQIGGGDPFVTWDGLSAKPGAGHTIDHIFIRERAVFQDVRATQQVAFAAPSLDLRLSDHLGIEAVLHLNPALSMAGVVSRQPESSSSSKVEAGQLIHASVEESRWPQESSRGLVQAPALVP